MFRFMIQKLLHKKWMLISLLIGNILLIAITCSYPMYKNASLKRMLADDFNQYILDNNSYPVEITIKGSMDKNNGIKEFKNKLHIADNLSKDFGIPEKEKITHYYIGESDAISIIGRDDKINAQKIKLGSVSNITDHINILSGKLYTNDITEDGFIEAIVSESAYENLNLIIGEEYQFQTLQDQSGNPLKVRITGVFESSKDQDYYWVMSPNSYKNDFIISESIFKNTLLNYNKQIYNIRADWYVLLDYTKINPDQVESIIRNTNKLYNNTNIIDTTTPKPDYLKVLMDYSSNVNKIAATLIILQVPILLLLCSFIFMISSQMLEMEQNEIALLKSRGSSKRQIVNIYLVQSILIALVSLLAGLPLGSFLCRVLGSTNAFLEFVQRRQLAVNISKEVLLYCFGAVIISTGVMVLPVFRHASVTIVNYKVKKNKRYNSIWQRFYLDIILLIVSIYGLYNFSQQKNVLLAKVLGGSPLDPFLYLSSSLFIIGASLVALRIQPLLVHIIFIIGKRKWKPAAYASFLQILRTGNKQNFIMVFLMFTIALGIFNSTIARTILSNEDNNIKYTTGADIVLSEIWDSNQAEEVSTDRKDNSDASTPTPTPALSAYYEPSYEKYENLEGASSVTKVTVRNDVKVVTDNKTANTKLMGIITKEFGETSWFKDNLLPTHYFNYLNALTSNASAVLVSSNFQDKYKYKIGDSIKYFTSDNKTPILGVIYGFIDYWPTYKSTTKTLNANGSIEENDNYLIVANLSQIQETWGVIPYQIWINAKDSTKFIYKFIEDKKLNIGVFEDTSEKLKEVRNDTIFQGTNGILTMSFIVILILSSAGFLIYWILSIRSRELLFGVLRAMGMTRREIIHILINEQIFSTGLSLITGTLIGVLAAKFFVPLIQITFSTTNQVIPLELITKANDMIRLFTIIIFVFILCMFILGRLITKIKISQALKLGED